MGSWSSIRSWRLTLSQPFQFFKLRQQRKRYHFWGYCVVVSAFSNCHSELVCAHGNKCGFFVLESLNVLHDWLRFHTFSAIINSLSTINVIIIIFGSVWYSCVCIGLSNLIFGSPLIPAGVAPLISSALRWRWLEDKHGEYIFTRNQQQAAAVWGLPRFAICSEGICRSLPHKFESKVLEDWHDGHFRMPWSSNGLQLSFQERRCISALHTYVIVFVLFPLFFKLRSSVQEPQFVYCLMYSIDESQTSKHEPKESEELDSFRRRLQLQRQRTNKAKHEADRVKTSACPKSPKSLQLTSHWGIFQLEREWLSHYLQGFFASQVVSRISEPSTVSFFHSLTYHIRHIIKLAPRQHKMLNGGSFTSDTQIFCVGNRSSIWPRLQTPSGLWKSDGAAESGTFKPWKCKWLDDLATFFFFWLEGGNASDFTKLRLFKLVVTVAVYTLVEGFCVWLLYFFGWVRQNLSIEFDR